MAKLVGTSGVATGREYLVGDLCIIGRSSNAQVRLADLTVSRQHAKISRSASGYVIEDQGSSQGTLVNGVTVTVSHLRHNDRISIAGTTFRFVDGPLERVPTADFSLIYDEDEAQVVSLDASEFARLQPLGEGLDAETITRLTRRLNAMLAVGRAVSSSLEPTALLTEVLRHCLEVFPTADRALVAIPNRDSQTLVVRSMVMREGVAAGGFFLSPSISSEVLCKGRSVVRNASGFTGVSRSDSGVGSSVSLMAAPLICRGQMLGLIYADRLQRGPAFGEEDLEVLTGMATQVAIALYTAQMHEGLMRQSRTDQELVAAHEVQKRFMPRGVPKVPGFTFVAHYDPSRDVGGDFYDFIPLGGSRMGIVVGDVSGKGFGASLVMAWVASQLRVAACQEKRPADVLARVNESLLHARQDELFVTIFYGVLERLTMCVNFSSAGHVPPFVRRAAMGQVEVVEEAAGLPVGMVSGARFEEGRILLDRGDTLVLVSDGVTEAMNPEKRMFGTEGLRAALERSSPNPTDLVCRVLAEMRGFVGQEPQYDDITLVALGASASTEDLRATMPTIRQG
jgi:serine phosphatase RsbU (regulator of sigma subunit)